MTASKSKSVDTRCRFNVYKASATSYKRLIDVETTSCVYWECYQSKVSTSKTQFRLIKHNEDSTKMPC